MQDMKSLLNLSSSKSYLLVPLSSLIENQVKTLVHLQTEQSGHLGLSHPASRSWQRDTESQLLHDSILRSKHTRLLLLSSLLTVL